MSIGAPALDLPTGLAAPPGAGFFMNLADLAFWLESARADAFLAKLEAKGTAAKFDALYAAKPDPYGTVTARYRYQRRKYAHLLSMIPARRYRAALDLGCGLGVFAELLAPHADEVVGIDVSDVALEAARTRTRALSNLRFEVGDIEQYSVATDRRFDLVTLLDILYYVRDLDDAKLKHLLDRILALCTPDAVVLVANHYFFSIDPESRTTRGIHDAFRWDPRLSLQGEKRFPFYLASVLEVRNGRAG